MHDIKGFFFCSVYSGMVALFIYQSEKKIKFMSQLWKKKETENLHL